MIGLNKMRMHLFDVPPECAFLRDTKDRRELQCRHYRIALLIAMLIHSLYLWSM